MISIEKAIKTSKVDVDRAAQLQSDRFLNSSKALCYTWTGLDTTGREVCTNSFGHQTAGCSLTSDRVLNENNLRPKYYNYVNLSPFGLETPNTSFTGGHGNYGIDMQSSLKKYSKFNDKIDI